jgi:riboflavin synthase alpha subunit
VNSHETKKHFNVLECAKVSIPGGVCITVCDTNHAILMVVCLHEALKKMLTKQL